MAQTGRTEPSEDRETSAIAYAAQVEEGKTLFGLQRLFWAVDAGADKFEHAPVRRDNDSIASKFPEICTKLVSPAFIWPETVPVGFTQGSESPTNADVSERFIHSIADRRSWLRMYQAPFTSEDGCGFSYIMLSTSGVSLDSYCSSSRKLRIWIQSGVHGNEPAGDQAVLALLGKLDEESTWAETILANADIFIMPRYNPEGIKSFNRPCSRWIDLNRDNIRQEVPQSRSIRKMFCRFQPHIAVDMHEYSAKSRHARSYIHGSDVMFAAAKNLNIHPKIRELSETLFATTIGLRLQKADFRSEPYIPISGSAIVFKEASSDGKIGRNAMGLTQCVSFLCETRGIGIADQHFHRRTAAGLKFLEAILEIAAGDSNLIRSALEEAVEQFVISNDPIVVQDQATTLLDRTFAMIDIKTGDLLQLPVKLLSSTPTVPTLTRARPEAYVLPRCLQDVVRRLKGSGLQVDQLEQEFVMDVEVLTIKTATFEQAYHEGIVPVKVTTIVESKRVTLPDGCFIVTTRQRNAALAFIALEPENVDSYVSTNVIPVATGHEYPVYRLLKPMKNQ